MAALYVIRHAQVNVDFNMPSSQWQVSEDGILATRALVSHENWHGIRCLYHSPEPKAAVTASIIRDMTGISIQMMGDLHELQIPIIQPYDEFVRRVGAYLGGHPDPEFEDYEQATTRIVGCVRRITTDAGGQSVAMVSHGRILTLLFAYLFKRRMTVEEWQSIQLPDLSVIDLVTWTVERGFFSHLPG